MKLPETIRIGGVDYSVVITDSLNDGMKVLCGQVDYQKSTIRIHSSDEHQFQCVTVLHEVLHAIAQQRGFELGKNEEKIIDGFAYGIYQVLQDNGKKLFDIASPESEGKDDSAGN